MLVLASKSSVRKALLAGAGLAFDVAVADVNEREIEATLAGEEPRAVAKALASTKAISVPGRVVIGADQVLELNGSLLHKPANMSAARAQLQRLRSRTHYLHAGVAIVIEGRLVWSDVSSAALTMRDFSDAELDHILAHEGEQVLASVGGYRLEGAAIRLFERIEGDYFTILGLPLLPLLAALRKHAPGVLGGFT